MTTNPCRNGILEMVDELARELEIGELEFKIMRSRLKSALNQSTEIQAEYFIRKTNKLLEGIICTIQK